MSLGMVIVLAAVAVFALKVIARKWSAEPVGPSHDHVKTAVENAKAAILAGHDGLFPCFLPDEKQWQGIKRNAAFSNHLEMGVCWDCDPLRKDDQRIMDSNADDVPCKNDALEWLELMGYAEVSMLSIFKKTEDIMNPEGSMMHMYGHRHVCEMLALPEAVRIMKLKLGSRFGALAPTRDNIFVFKLDDNELLSDVYKKAQKLNFESLIPLPMIGYYVEGDELSTFTIEGQISTEQFKLCDKVKSIGTGSIRPEGIPEVTLSRGEEVE